MKKLRKAFQVVACFAMTMAFLWCQNEAMAANDSTRIDQKTAEKIALVSTRHLYPAAKLIYTDIVFNYDDGKPCQFLVVMATSNDFRGYSKEDLLAFYAQNEKDRSMTAKLHAGVSTVHISATKNYYPVGLDKSGLPTHTMRRQELRERAASVLRIEAKELTEGALVCIYGRGLFQELKSRDEKNRTFIEVFKLTTLDPDAAAAAMIKGREEDNREKDDRINRLREDWERYERQIQEEDVSSSLEPLSSPSVATTPAYIANYNDPSLKWSQSEITSHLTCSTSGGCCFVAAPTSVLAFWDDSQYSWHGPFEGLVQSGEGSNQTAVSALATDIYNNTAFLGACWDLFFITPCAYQTSGGVDSVARGKKYLFSTNGTSYPSSSNVITEVTNNKPFVWMVGNYTYTNAGSIDHAMACYGYYYDDANKFRILCYTNWSNGEIARIYYNNPNDYFDTHAMVSITPGFPVSHAFSNVPTSVTRGSSLTFTTTETNSADFSFTYYIYPYSILPNGIFSWGTPTTTTLNAGATLTLNHSMFIPQESMAGDYVRGAQIIDEYVATVDSDSFAYTVQ